MTNKKTNKLIEILNNDQVHLLNELININEIESLLNTLGKRQMKKLYNDAYSCKNSNAESELFCLACDGKDSEFWKVKKDYYQKLLEKINSKGVN